jgi:hypothetical protein
MGTAQLFTNSGTTVAMNPVVMPEYWRYGASGDGASGALYPGDPFCGIVNYKQYANFATFFSTPGTNVMALQQAHSIQQTNTFVFRTFPVTAFSFLDLRPGLSTVSLAIPSSQLGRIYTEGAINVTGQLSTSYPIVAVNGMTLGASGFLSMSLGNYYAISGNSSGGKATNILLCGSGYAGGATNAVILQAGQSLSTIKQTAAAGALLGGDEKIGFAGVADTNTATLVTGASTRVDIVMGVGFSINALGQTNCGIIPQGLQTSRSATNINAAAIWSSVTWDGNTPPTLLVDVAEMMGTNRSSGYPASVYIDQSSLGAGSSVVITNSPASGVNGISVISNGRLTIAGSYGGYSSTQKNLIMAPAFTVSSPVPGSTVNLNASVIGDEYQNLGAMTGSNVSTVNILGTYALWGDSSGAGQATPSVNPIGDADMASGLVTPPVVPAVTTVLCVTNTKTSGVQ